MLRRAPCWSEDQRKTGNRLHFKLESLTSIVPLPSLALGLHIINLWEFLELNVLYSINADGLTVWESLSWGMEENVYNINYFVVS